MFAVVFGSVNNLLNIAGHGSVSITAEDDESGLDTSGKLKGN